MSNKVEKIKIVLLGDVGVGKSYIISRYIRNEFNENKAPTPTSGAYNYQKTIKIGDKEVLLELWDTAGQEKFRSLGKIFYQNAEAVCLVYDITNKKSFENLKNNWYEDLQQYGRKDVIIAVVGNKCDLYETEQVTKKQAEKFAKEKRAFFQLTSAKCNVGINELFKSLAEKYLNQENIRERTESFLLNNKYNGGCCKKKKCC